MLQLYRLNADTKKGCHYRWYVKEYHLFIDGSDGRVLSDPYARKGHSLYSSEHPKRYALGVVSNAIRAE